VQKLKRRTKPLKVVNPNAKVEEDAWTSEELLDFIEQKWEEVARAIGSLAAFMMYNSPMGKTIACNCHNGTLSQITQ
jgi:hypothetical protein